jgi:hypothetical protein
MQGYKMTNSCRGVALLTEQAFDCDATVCIHALAQSGTVTDLSADSRFWVGDP